MFGLFFIQGPTGVQCLPRNSERPPDPAGLLPLLLLHMPGQAAPERGRPGAWGHLSGLQEVFTPGRHPSQLLYKEPG